MPQVSVIMSTYSRNHGDKTCPNMLRRALDSILGQSFCDFELILIDDGSTDGSETVCREYEMRDRRVRFYRFGKNSGLPARRYNDGMWLARSDLFMFMFDDDYWLPNAIQDLYDAITITHKASGMVYGLTDFVNSETGAKQGRFGGEWNLDRLREGNYLCNLSVIVKRGVIDEVGGYDEDPLFRRLCDWDLWLRIGMEFQVSRINKCVGTCYHSQPDSIGVKVALSEVEKSVLRARQKTDRLFRLKNRMSKRFRICFAHSTSNETLLRWSVDYLCAALQQDGIDAKSVNVGTQSGRAACDSADVVMFYRTSDAESLDFAKRLKMNGKFVLYSIDDYIFQPGCKYSPNMGKHIVPFFDVVDAIVSPNSNLLERMPPGKVKILRRNVIDQETFDVLNPGQFVGSAPNCYAVGWLAGVNRREMDAFAKTMLQSLDEKLAAGENVTFVCFGKHGLRSLKSVEVVERPYFSFGQWKELYQCYRSYAFSVVINPLDEKDEFCHCKSELKYVETGALWVPLITARVHPFTEIVKEGANGLFASTPEEFADKILTVCRDRALAEKVATAAHHHVKEEYDSVHNARQFLADVIECLPPDLAEDNDYMKQEKEKLRLTLWKLEQFDSEVVGPVPGGNQIEMVIPLLPTCEIKSISVLGATYCKNPRCSSGFQAWVNGRKMRDSGFRPETMVDNAWWKVNVTPFSVGSGDTLTIRIINHDPDVKLGFYVCKDQLVGRAKIATKQVRPIAVRIEVKGVK